MTIFHVAVNGWPAVADPGGGGARGRAPPREGQKKKKKKKRKKRVFPDKELLFPNVLHASPEAAAGHPRDNRVRGAC